MSAKPPIRRLRRSFLTIGSIAVACGTLALVRCSHSGTAIDGLEPAASRTDLLSGGRAATELSAVRAEILDTRKPLVEDVEAAPQASMLAANGRAIAGVLCLRDGTPIPGVAVCAYDSGEKETGGGQYLGADVSDLQGVFSISPREQFLGEFRLSDARPGGFGEFSGEWEPQAEALRCVVPVAAICTRVLDERGRPARGHRVHAWVETAEGKLDPIDPFGLTDAQGRLQFHFRQAGRTFVAAFDEGATRSAVSSPVEIRIGRLGPEVNLVLTSARHTGRVAVDVRGPEGAPVERFAVSLTKEVLSRNQSFSFSQVLDSRESVVPPANEKRSGGLSLRLNPLRGNSRLEDTDSLPAERIVAGLLPGEWTIALEESSMRAPTYYDLSGVSAQRIDVSADEVATARFTVALRGRVELNVEFRPGMERRLAASVRRANSPPEAWTKLSWSAFARAGVSHQPEITSAGRWFSQLLDEGDYIVRVVELPGDVVVWSARAVITPGRASEVRVSL